jgi:hypothetical protein
MWTSFYCFIYLFYRREWAGEGEIFRGSPRHSLTRLSRHVGLREGKVAKSPDDGSKT